MEDTKRRLNMDEKRQLEKLIFSDIDQAATKYATTRQLERGKLQERLVEKASPAVVALFAELKSAAQTIATAEKKLSELGFRLDGYGTDRKLAIAYSNLPRELVAFDHETNQRQKKIAGLKRDYTLRLYAAGEEARDLFALLANEITKVLS
jgi:hypothetical protein